MLFTSGMPDDDYRKLGLGEELMIVDLDADLTALKDRMYRWGRTKGVKYKVTTIGKRTYIKCLPRQDRRVSTKVIGKVARRKTTCGNRSPWRRNEHGTYWCLDFQLDIRWEIKRDGDAMWPWTIYRDGAAVAQARTIYAAKAEAASLK